MEEGVNMRKKLIAIILAITMVLSLTACGSNIVEDADTAAESIAKFERHTLYDNHYSILVDKKTGVCYLEYKDIGAYAYGITVLLNTDGTPKILGKE